jgi:hypothetical protein
MSRSAVRVRSSALFFVLICSKKVEQRKRPGTLAGPIYSNLTKWPLSTEHRWGRPLSLSPLALVLCRRGVYTDCLFSLFLKYRRLVKVKSTYQQLVKYFKVSIVDLVYARRVCKLGLHKGRATTYLVNIWFGSYPLLQSPALLIKVKQYAMRRHCASSARFLLTPEVKLVAR